jgi:hypothetical protein
MPRHVAGGNILSRVGTTSGFSNVRCGFVYGSSGTCWWEHSISGALDRQRLLFHCVGPREAMKNAVFTGNKNFTAECGQIC